MVYSKQLILPAGVFTTPIQWLYTCPTGIVAVVKELYTCSFAANQCTWWFRPSAGGTPEAWDLTKGAGTFNPLRQQVRFVLTEGQEIGFNVSTTGGAIRYASGYELTA